MMKEAVKNNTINLEETIYSLVKKESCPKEMIKKLAFIINNIFNTRSILSINIAIDKVRSDIDVDNGKKYALGILKEYLIRK